MNQDWIIPEWPAPACVRALCTTRSGGHSSGPWLSMNLGFHCGDEPEQVMANRAELASHLPAEPLWLRQIHGTGVFSRSTPPGSDTPEADAQISRHPNQVCAILTADCLPVLFCDHSASIVGVAHAGWRGLASGVLENTVQAMGIPAGQLLAWLGPAIAGHAYEVGENVRSAFVSSGDASAAACFMPRGDKWLFDLYAMARLRLKRIGIEQVSGGAFCTFSEPERFFSYRRDGITGRMASLIWLSG